MHTRTRPIIRTITPAALLALALSPGLTGCSDGRTAETSDSSRARAATETPGTIAPARTPARITIDGDFGDWPADARALSDGEHLYLRLHIDEADTLQAGRQTYRIDLDANGLGLQADEAMNDELSIAFSPPHRGSVGSGVEITIGDEVLRATDIDLLFAPTYASSEFELRIDLDRCGPTPAIEALGQHHTAVPIPQSVATIDCLPNAPADAIRVMSMNVLFASPMGNAKPFARLINAIEPDIILLQEWQDRDGTFSDEDVVDWLQQHAPYREGWQIVSSDGWGVVVASAHPIRRFGPSHLSRTADAPGDTHIPDRAIRFAGAVIETPRGDVLAASVHLKCCGSANSEEDTTRMAEALSINNSILGNLGPNAPAVRIIAGDLNLVGSRPPIDALRNSLDTDGSDLAVAATPVLNDGSVYTWYDPTSRFGPGRLDYVLYSDHAADLVNAFAIDTQRLEDRCLDASGLRRDDSRATDHLVLVADVRPVTNP